jgi:hypothetical protein
LQVQSDLHVYGHSHINTAVTIAGRRYVQYALEAADSSRVQLMCVWDGQRVCSELVDGR